MMTTANDVTNVPPGKLSEKKICQLETEIDNGSVDAMVAYAEDATQYYSEDLDELKRRKRKLFGATNSGGYAPVLQSIAILAAMTNDHSNWEVVVETFGKSIPPKLGYYAYQKVKNQKIGQEWRKDWYYILEQSAKNGFLLARKDVTEKKFKRYGIAGLIPFNIYKFWLSLVAIKIAIKDPNDPRLPIVK